MKRILLGMAGIGLFLSACSQSVPDTKDYKVEIRRTAYGVPHIEAKDYASLGFGDGYVIGQDQVCNFADSVVAARGELAKYHGVGPNNSNLISDIASRTFHLESDAQKILPTLPKETQDWLQGYADGYNQYLKETTPEGVTSWCKGADWLQPVTAADVYARVRMFVLRTERMGAFLAGATAPANAHASLHVGKTQMAAAMEAFLEQRTGSNGWALGKDSTENGHGMLMGNPHYFWSGFNRFTEKHLVIPGKLDAYGASLVGIPGIVMGFNDNIAWTPTVSASRQMTFYRLNLVPGKPTHYMVDGQDTAMTSETFAIAVKGEDGATTTKEHTAWYSEFGPVVSIAQLPGGAWGTEHALALHNVNMANVHLLSQWRDMSEAGSMDDFIAAFDKWNALPWLNTMATSKDGRAVYIDDSNVPNLSAATMDAWQKARESDPLTKLMARYWMPLLPGDTTKNLPVTDAASRMEGALPFKDKPMLERGDYVFNANDNYWLANSHELLTGKSPMYGDVETPRSVRTRMNDLILRNAAPWKYAGDDDKYSLPELQHALFDDASLMAHLVVNDLVKACEQTPDVKVNDKNADLKPACDVLAGYDQRFTLDSKGAVLFREWLNFNDAQRRGRNLVSSLDGAGFFSVPFDPKDPVGTPNTLARPQDALVALAQAASFLTQQGIALDASMRDEQFSDRGGVKIPVGGGNNREGVANIVEQWPYPTTAPQNRGKVIQPPSTLTDQGYLITGGSSYILGVSFGADGPDAQALLDYGQSGDPTSPHFNDQMVLFSKSEMRPVYFRDDDVKANTQTVLELKFSKTTH